MVIDRSRRCSNLSSGARCRSPRSTATFNKRALLDDDSAPLSGYGPHARFDDRVVATRLSAFLDVNSRYVVEARYYYDEKLDVLCDSFLRALTTHGAPGAIYVDNAKVYRSNALSAFCLRLTIKRLHRKPRDPAGGGGIERVIQTIQDLFEVEVRSGPILTLDELNQSFVAWLDVDYHDAEHSMTKQPPRERLEAGMRARRNVDLQAAVESFYRSVKRVVHVDFADVRVDNVFYRVDQKFRTLKVEVRCPLLELGDTVLIYDRQGGSFDLSLVANSCFEEPDASIAHVRIYGGSGRAISLVYPRIHRSDPTPLGGYTPRGKGSGATATNKSSTPKATGSKNRGIPVAGSDCGDAWHRLMAVLSVCSDHVPPTE